MLTFCSFYLCQNGECCDKHQRTDNERRAMWCGTDDEGRWGRFRQRDANLVLAGNRADQRREAKIIRRAFTPGTALTSNNRDMRSETTVFRQSYLPMRQSAGASSVGKQRAPYNSTWPQRNAAPHAPLSSQAQPDEPCVHAYTPVVVGMLESVVVAMLDSVVVAGALVFGVCVVAVDAVVAVAPNSKAPMQYQSQLLSLFSFSNFTYQYQAKCL